MASVVTDVGGPPFSLAEVRSLAARLADDLVVTPVTAWECDETLDALGADTRIILKLELFQRTGTFKPRGALTVLADSAPDALRNGVTAVSAGNHAIAVAYAAKRRGISAKVVMTSSASPARIERCRRFGAEVVLAPDVHAAFEMVEAIKRDERRLFVHPFEGPLTALGTATLGLEFAEQAGPLDAVVIPIGGGGLCAGAANAIKLIQPDCLIYGVEPVGADAMSRSFAAGEPVRLERIDTIADSLAPPFALPYSFDLCRRAVERIVLVSDDEICAAVDILFRAAKLAVEPAGASALAAALGPLRAELAGKRVGLLVCGTNIDLETFYRHAGRGQALNGRL